MSKIDNFAYPIPIPAKIWGCSLWSRSVISGSADSEMVRLISREIIFAEFERIWSRYLNVTDGQTDGRTTCHGNTALRVASRGNNNQKTLRLSKRNVNLKKCHSNKDLIKTPTVQSVQKGDSRLWDVLHSTREPGELWQWLYHDDSTSLLVTPDLF